MLKVLCVHDWRVDAPVDAGARAAGDDGGTGAAVARGAEGEVDVAVAAVALLGEAGRVDGEAGVVEALVAGRPGVDHNAECAGAASGRVQRQALRNVRNDERLSCCQGGSGSPKVLVRRTLTLV